jgi:L-fuculose-phosphate aldolase
MFEKDVERIGKRLFAEGLVGGYFGNLSARDEDGFYITCTGSILDEPGDLVFVPLEGPVPKNASNEYRVHREVYRITRHGAIVHAHPPHAVACSLLSDEIIPQDSEGQMLCPLIPVVRGQPGTDDLAISVAGTLRTTKLAVARGHGTFAAGKTLDEAYFLTSLAERSCRVLAILAQFR